MPTRSLDNNLREQAFPFPHVQMNDADARRVDASLESWCDRFGRRDARFHSVSRAYVVYCAPAKPPPLGIDLVAQYVAWFFAMNDEANGELRGHLIAEARAALIGATEPTAPEAKAAAGLLESAVNAWGKPATRRLAASMISLLDAFAWELENIDARPSTAEYLRHREHTIANYPFVELWRLSLSANPEAALASRVEGLEKLNTRLVYLVNDLMSVYRDRRKHKLNLVDLESTEAATSIEAAYEKVMGLLRADLGNFTQQWTEIRALASADAALLEYIDYLAALVEGNRLATSRLNERFWGNE